MSHIMNNVIGASKPISLETLEELRQEFLLNGFLYFPSFLSKKEIDFYVDVLYRLDKTQAYGSRRTARKPGDPIEVRNVLSHAPEFIELIDQEKVLMLISYLMGYNIQICNSQAFIKPGFPEGTTIEQQGSFGWHTDMQRNAEAINGILPRFSIRTGYFLSTLDQPNMGSIKIVPGSHRSAGVPAWNFERSEPYGAVELFMEEGSLLIFDNRIWHTQCLNYSNRARVNFYAEYSWRWMRPIDYDAYSEDLLNACTPLRKQLLGYSFTDVNEGFLGYVLPNDVDVPLKAWLEERGLGHLPQVVGEVPIGDFADSRWTRF
jgi:hypothetical protein